MFEIPMLLPGCKTTVYAYSESSNSNSNHTYDNVHDDHDDKATSKCMAFEGPVIEGFGRGGKLLNCPTANIPIPSVNDNELDSYNHLKNMSTGIYFGYCRISKGEFASIDPSTIRNMVMSIGWNPFFQNTEKTIEAHVLEKFEHDFYGAYLQLWVAGYIRPERSFESLDALKAAIEHDCQVAREALEMEPFVSLKQSLVKQNHWI